MRPREEFGAGRGGIARANSAFLGYGQCYQVVGCGIKLFEL